ncbi:MAG: hypothetical protein K6T16_00275 [Candidatus Pacearchaeota archaeon]|nr:hypothetical protein [Candidatus Pacearchaeota archaeon]
MNKLYNAIKRPVGRGICYLTLLATATGAVGCGKSAAEKKISDLEQQTRYEQAQLAYEKAVTERMIGQIENTKKVKDELYELEKNFYDLNKDRLENNMLPVIVQLTYPSVIPGQPNPPSQRGFYPQERSSDKPTVKNNNKGAWGDGM